MARQITVLEVNTSDGGEITVRAAFWFPVTVGQEVASPGFVSAVRTSPRGSITGQEATDLADGKVVEEVQSLKFPATYTTAQVQAFLVKKRADRLTYRNSLTPPWTFYGMVYDGAAWGA